MWATWTVHDWWFRVHPQQIEVCVVSTSSTARLSSSPPTRPESREVSAAICPCTHEMQRTRRREESQLVPRFANPPVLREEPWTMFYHLHVSMRNRTCSICASRVIHRNRAQPRSRKHQLNHQQGKNAIQHPSRGVPTRRIPYPIDRGEAVDFLCSAVRKRSAPKQY